MALEHPTRRRILRALHQAEAPQCPSDLSIALSGSGVNVISYHAQVLERHGLVQASGVWTYRGSSARLYASKVAADSGITALLRATEGPEGTNG